MSGEQSGEPREETVSQGGGVSFSFSGGDERSEPENATLLAAVVGLTAHAKKLRDGKGAEAERGAAAPAPPLPCLFVTTASKDELPPLPGPRKKQAQALTDNIEWMAATFGKERIGFLTLTLGDLDAGGRFRNMRDRKEAQRRFHSLLTNEISGNYVCGVTVTERHQNQGLHFHLVVACKEDTRGNIDFRACFPPKDDRGKVTTCTRKANRRHQMPGSCKRDAKRVLCASFAFSWQSSSGFSRWNWEFIGKRDVQ